MKKNICKKIFAVVCVMSVIFTSFSVNATEETGNFQDSKYADWEQITFSDYGIEDGVQPGSMTDIQGFTLQGKELAGKVFNGDFKFTADYAHFAIGGLTSPLGGLNVYSDVGEFYLFLPESEQPILDSETAGTELIDNEFNLKLSYDVYDSDGDGSEDCLKLGVWINDKLLNNEYAEISTWQEEVEPGVFLDHDYTEYLGNNFGIFIPTENGSLTFKTPGAEEATESVADGAKEDGSFNPLYVAIPVVIVIAIALAVILGKRKKSDAQ